MKKIFVVIAILAAAAAAEASWYDFARNDSAPEIDSLQVGPIEMEEMVEVLVLAPGDLKGSKLIIRGTAETTRGSIGAVLLSVDGGRNFKKAKLTRSGAFLFDFSPLIDREYELQIKVLDTTGRGSDPKDGAFYLVVRPDQSGEKARKLFAKLLNLYQNKDRSGFMALVSDDFEGDRNALEDALDDDFRSLDSIRIIPSISRVSSSGGLAEISFRFERTVQSRISGKTLKDNSGSAMTFIRKGDTLLLYSMSAPLIFGVSGTSEIAEQVDIEAEGDTVLAITADGDAITVEQKDTVSETTDQTVSNIVTGTLNVSCVIDLSSPLIPVCPAIKLDAQAAIGLVSGEQMFHSNMAGTGGDITIYPLDPDFVPGVKTCLWTLESGSGMLDTGKTSFSDVSTVSSDAGDYQLAVPADNPFPVVLNRVVAVKTPESYALLRAISANCSLAGTDYTINASFEYKIQLSQNPSF